MEPPKPTSRPLIQVAKFVQAGAVGGLLSVPVFEVMVPESAGYFVACGLEFFVVPGLIASFLIRKAFPNRAFCGAIMIGVFVVAFWVAARLWLATTKALASGLQTLLGTWNF